MELLEHRLVVIEHIELSTDIHTIDLSLTNILESSSGDTLRSRGTANRCCNKRIRKRHPIAIEEFFGERHIIHALKYNVLIICQYEYKVWARWIQTEA